MNSFWVQKQQTGFSGFSPRLCTTGGTTAAAASALENEEQKNPPSVAPILILQPFYFPFLFICLSTKFNCTKTAQQKRGGTHRQTSTTQAHRHTKNSRATFFLTKKDLSWLLEAQTHKAAGSLHFLFTFFLQLAANFTKCYSRKIRTQLNPSVSLDSSASVFCFTTSTTTTLGVSTFYVPQISPPPNHQLPIDCL